MLGQILFFFITFLSLKTNRIIKKSQDLNYQYFNRTIKMSFILPASLLTFIYDNKSLISVYMYMISNDGVHKLVQLQVYCIHACRKRGTNMAY